LIDYHSYRSQPSLQLTWPGWQYNTVKPVELERTKSYQNIC